MTTTGPTPSIVKCLCGQKNRLPASIAPGMKVRCGHCKKTLVDSVPAIDDLDEDLDDDDEDEDE